MSQFSFEFAGSEVVAGVDEVGRGPLCGDVAAFFKVVVASTV